jgi:methylthioribose-1-phosphate isomerase
LQEPKTLYWEGDALYILDQRLLPHREKYLRCTSYRQVARAIKDMAVRGAPAIGVAAAYGLVLAARGGAKPEKTLKKLRMAAEALRSTRPTAVNLFWAIDRMVSVADRAVSEGLDLYQALLQEANRLMEQDVETNKRIGEYGARLIPDGATVMTYCNAGALATAGYGTAIGVIRAAVESGKKLSVLVPETRPRLQGARLTAFELSRLGIPYRIITDNMAAMLMSRGQVSCIVVGADRVLARTGHVINKIGTLSLAISARYFNVPLYVAAPLSSIDFENTPETVKIEERCEEEVLRVAGKLVAPKGARAVNLAFDITPPELVTSIITEWGVYEPAGLASLRRYSTTQLV